eukprot:m.25066 g.25066  ORF g.25066 m.25066 type:complete len:56 (+) comp13130_c0_seq4:1551-1718(+)
MPPFNAIAQQLHAACHVCNKCSAGTLHRVGLPLEARLAGTAAHHICRPSGVVRDA